MTSIDNFLGVHAQAVTLRSARAELLAGNLANADTPGYRPQDLDFAAAMKQATVSGHGKLRASHPAHIPVGKARAETHSFFRDAPQRSLDENSVNTEFERAQFAENDVRYQASVQFLSGKINSIVRALRGD